jgi:hypothetical protein
MAFQPGFFGYIHPKNTLISRFEEVCSDPILKETLGERLKKGMLECGQLTQILRYHRDFGSVTNSEWENSAWNILEPERKNAWQERHKDHYQQYLRHK